MNKREYMQRLYAALSGLPEEKRNKIMNDYELQFRIELQKGKTEQAIIFNLGSPENAAVYFINMNQPDKGYHDNYTIQADKIENSSTAHSWETAVWGTLSVVIVPLMFAFMLLLFAISVALFAAGIVIIFSGLMLGSLSAGFWILAAGGLFLVTFGVLAAILSIYDGSRLIGKYFGFVGRRIKYGGGKR